MIKAREQATSLVLAALEVKFRDQVTRSSSGQNSELAALRTKVEQRCEDGGCETHRRLPVNR